MWSSLDELMGEDAMRAVYIAAGKLGPVDV